MSDQNDNQPNPWTGTVTSGKFKRHLDATKK